MSKQLKIDHWVPAYNQQINVNIVPQTHRDAMHAAEAGHVYRFWSQHSCDLVAMRNQALHRSLCDGFDYLLMQDSDVFSTAPQGPLMPMLETMRETEATVVGALVTMRTNPPRANVWPVYPGEVFEAEKIGTGMVLLDLNKIREWYEDYDGPCFQRAYKTNKSIEPQTGMDIFFSYVVREHGGTVVCDGRIPTVHINAVSMLPYNGQPDPAETGESDLADTRVATAG